MPVTTEATKRHEKHAQIEIRFGDPRDGLRTQGAEQIQSPDGEKHAGKSADECQQNAFGQHLPQQTRRTRRRAQPEWQIRVHARRPAPAAWWSGSRRRSGERARPHPEE